MSQANLIKLIFLIFLLLPFKTVAQTFRTVQNGNWNNVATWNRANMCGAESYNMPPPTGGFFPACEINTLIEHEINFNLGTQFGAGYFKSLNVAGGILNFPGPFEVSNAGSNVGGLEIFVSDGGRINVNGTTTFRAGASVNFEVASQLNTINLVIENSAAVNIDMNSKINASGNFSLRANSQLNITGNSIVEVENLTLEGDNAVINIEEGSSLIVRNQTNMPQGPNAINVRGNFKSGSLNISGGNNRVNISGNGTTLIDENVSLTGDGRLVLTDNAGFVIGGTLTISNSGGTGTNQTPNTSLIVLSTGSSLAAGKTPSGGCFQTPENGITCESNACVEVIDLFEGTEVVIIFRCNSTWFPPEGLTQYEVLVVGGGGSGGRTDTANGNNSNKSGGGGGGGAVRFQVINIPEPGLPADEAYTIEIGQGGRSDGANAAQRRGQPSTFTYAGGTTILAGGGGGGANNTTRNGLAGVNGGSGGGAGVRSNNQEGTGGAGNNPGNRGGDSFSSGNSSRQWGGGGGGAGGPGEDVGNSNARGGAGGIGFLSGITGTPTRYAAGGGGGGSTETNRFGEGGNGGGGDGGDGNRLATPGMANSGGGGGGSGNNRLGGNGGSGVVIIRYEVARILPVEFLYFNGELNESESKITLNWATAKEWESSHFEVMRSYEHIGNWEKIGEVKATGFSDQIEEYQFEDKGNYNYYKMAYYQLKQVDFDQSYQFSEVIGIQLPNAFEKNNTWTVFPNPVDRETANLILSDRDNYVGGAISATLVNPLGKSKTFFGSNITELSQLLNQALLQSVKGVYVLHLVWEKQDQQIKILKR